ncbi:MAG TPA: MFS transporter [Acidimicrobiales bacterium]|nr:MFS transporter [Acidimicrobiales bacterium]
MSGGDAGGRRASYKWVALANTTLGVLMATIDASIVLIAMPDIFRGIRLDPLLPSNSFYLLWMMLSFLVVSSVLVVSLGRLGDMYGRVRMYTLGFAVYTAASLLLSVTWMTGEPGAAWLVAMRVVQGVGAAFLVANSSAILTDAFPPDQRGMALGINNVAGISGAFIGLVLGGLLGPLQWRLVFIVSVPFGLAGTLWALYKLEETGQRRRAPVDWAGNLTFGLGLVLVMVGITYGIEPHGGRTMGWTSPAVVAELAGGVGLLGAFVVIESRVAHPMFKLSLFRIRAFLAGSLSSFLAAIGRGGLMFMLIIWLQGIWLPLHGYDFERTPLWAGIFMLPLTFGFLVAGPVSGILSDRYGARPFATGGMLGAAATFVLLQLLPINFSYPLFALILLVNGLMMGAFAAPNRAGVMNSLPPEDRGAGSGMNSTFQNSAQVLSIGVFFTLMILGLSSGLPHSLYAGLVHQGVPQATAQRASHLPPVSTLFAAFLGYNPLAHLLGPSVLGHLTQAQASALTSREFFPGLIAGPFRSGLHAAFDFAVVACLVAALASWSRGSRFVYGRPPGAASLADGAGAGGARPARAEPAPAGRGGQRGGGR